MRILVVTQHYHPETMATGRRARELVEDFAAAGHAVTVLAGMPNHPTSRGPQFRRLPAHERLAGGIELRRVPVLSGPSGAAARRLLTYATFAATSVLRGALARQRFDAVVAISPLPTGLAAAIIATAKRAPLVFDLQDVWPESAAIAGVMRRGAAFKAIERLEKGLYRRAAAVTVITQGFKRRLVDMGIDPAKVHFVPNGVDVALFEQATAAGAATAHGLPDGFRIVFAGNMGLVQDLDTVLDAAKLLPTASDVSFVLVGDGVRRPHLESRIAAERIEHVHLIPSQPRDAIPGLMAAADASLVCLVDRPLFAITIPSKTYECMAAARPVLCGVAGETRALIEEAGCGVAYQPGDPNDLLRAIDHIRTEPAGAMGQAGRRWVQEHATRAMVTDQYLRVVEGVARRCR